MKPHEVGIVKLFLKKLIDEDVYYNNSKAFNLDSEPDFNVLINRISDKCSEFFLKSKWIIKTNQDEYEISKTKLHEKHQKAWEIIFPLKDKVGNKLRSKTSLINIENELNNYIFRQKSLEELYYNYKTKKQLHLNFKRTFAWFFGYVLWEELEFDFNNGKLNDEANIRKNIKIVQEKHLESPNISKKDWIKEELDLRTINKWSENKLILELLEEINYLKSLKNIRKNDYDSIMKDYLLHLTKDDYNNIEYREEFFYLYNCGRIEDSIIILEKIKSKKEKSNLLFLIASNYYNKGDGENAVKYIYYSYKLNKKNPLTLYYLGLNALIIKKEKEASYYFKKILELNFIDLKINLFIGQFFQEIKEYNLGIKSLKKIENLSNTKPDILFWFGLNYLGLNDTKKAEKKLKLALKFKSRIKLTSIILSWVYIINSKYDLALELLNEIKQKKKYQSLAMFYIGVIFREKNQLDKAIKYYKKSLKSKSRRNNMALCELSYILYLKGDIDNAEIFVKNSLTKKLDDDVRFKLLLVLSTCYSKKGFLKKQVNVLKKAKSINDKKPEISYLIATIQTKLKNYNEAIINVKDSISLDNSNSKYRFLLGTLYFFNREKNKSYYQFLRLVQIEYNYVEEVMGSLIFYQRTKEIDKIINLLLSLLKMSFNTALTIKKIIYRLNVNYETYLKLSILIEIRIYEINFLLGDFYLQKGNTMEAIRHFKNCHKICKAEEVFFDEFMELLNITKKKNTYLNEIELVKKEVLNS